MGNICHAGPIEAASSNNGVKKITLKKSNQSGENRPAPTFGKDPKLNRSDYMFTRIKGPQTLIKLPGSINGQQFIIEECEDCDIFLLDHCTAVQIDECKNCRIFVGPCDSSLFIRNASKCTIVGAVQQLRTRDCDHVDFYLYSATEPIIETSSMLNFACLPVSYFSLQSQFEKTKFSIWNNRWSEIHNFSPAHGGWEMIAPSADKLLVNKSDIEADVNLWTFWNMPSGEVRSLGFTGDAAQLTVPITMGFKSIKEDEKSVIVCFVSSKQHVAMDFVTKMAQQTTGASILIRTREMKLTKDQAMNLFNQNKTLVDKALEVAENGSGSIILEFQGPQCYEDVQSILQDVAFQEESNNMFISKDNEQTKNQSDLVFEQWKVKV